jgi:hypothetical protein
LCTSVPQGADYICEPLDLLSTITTCFSIVIAYIFWCSSCGQNLIQFATHCCPTATTVCATCMSAESQNSLPKNAHEHYHDVLKTLHTKFHTSILTLWIASWGVHPLWPHLQDSLVPRSFLVNWPLVRLAHLCTPCTDQPCSNRSENY